MTLKHHTGTSIPYFGNFVLVWYSAYNVRQRFNKQIKLTIKYKINSIGPSNDRFRGPIKFSILCYIKLIEVLITTLDSSHTSYKCKKSFVKWLTHLCLTSSLRVYLVRNGQWYTEWTACSHYTARPIQVKVQKNEFWRYHSYIKRDFY